MTNNLNMKKTFLALSCFLVLVVGCNDSSPPKPKQIYLEGLSNSPSSNDSRSQGFNKPNPTINDLLIDIRSYEEARDRDKYLDAIYQAGVVCSSITMMHQIAMTAAGLEENKQLEQLSTDTFALAASLKNGKQAVRDIDITFDEYVDWLRQMQLGENHIRSEAFLEKSLTECESFIEDMIELVKKVS